jgi:hypothetical protein
MRTASSLRTSALVFATVIGVVPLLGTHCGGPIPVLLAENAMGPVRIDLALGSSYALNCRFDVTLTSPVRRLTIKLKDGQLLLDSSCQTGQDCMTGWAWGPDPPCASSDAGSGGDAAGPGYSGLDLCSPAPPACSRVGTMFVVTVETSSGSTSTRELRLAEGEYNGGC